MVSSDRSNSANRWLVVGYDQYLEKEVANEILATLCRYHLAQVSPDGWLTAGSDIAGYIGDGRFSGLVLLDPDLLGLAANDQYHLRQCLALFSKRTDIDVGVDRRSVAVAKFREAEDRCRLTNSCFRAWKQGRFQFRPLVERVLHAASIKISRVLGDCPSLSDLRPHFGPGATTQVPKKNACLLTKLQRVPACSANFTEPEEALRQVWRGNGEAEEWVDIEIHAARLSFVPKNAKTDRAICTEPQLNGMFQLAVGDVIAHRLRKVGIDIRDQTPNQRAALRGSISGDTATLDLTSASDTVSLGLVEHLLPEDWNNLLLRLRSCEVEYEGEILELAKISSMGNGFTFPLETLIFWALSQSVQEIYARDAEERVLVYGDDIVVATAAAEPLIAVLLDLGFVPNPTKSFWKGNFRESCGKDYVLGIDVRPVYSRTRPVFNGLARALSARDADPRMSGSDMFRIHNFYVKTGQHQPASIVESFIHPSIRLRGPEGYGDGYLHSNVWVSHPVGKKKGWSGYSFDSWCFSTTRMRDDMLERLGEPGKRKNTFVYRKCHTKRVLRVATYATYIRENADRYGEHRLPVPDSRSDTDFFVLPGRGDQVHRTKIYIFESPTLKQQ